MYLFMSVFLYAFILCISHVVASCFGVEGLGFVRGLGLDLVEPCVVESMLVTEFEVHD